MAFRLETKARVGDQWKRGVVREIDKALSALRAVDDWEEAAFDARKRMKKVRAALRLVRDELGDAVYRRENYFFRDVARSLREVRDAAMFVEALDEITRQLAGEIEAGAFDGVPQGTGGRAGGGDPPGARCARGPRRRGPRRRTGARPRP